MWNLRTKKAKRIFVHTGFPLWDWRNLLAISSSDGAILHEDGSVGQHLRRLGELKIPIWRTYSKVDSDAVAGATKVDSDVIREGIHIPQDSVVISTVARADPTKGIEEIVNAFPVIARQLPKAILVLCVPTPPYAYTWDNEYPKRIENLITSLDRDLRERIRWVRTGLDRYHTLKLMTESDVLVFSSPYTNGGIALREAMCVGAAIVASDNPGTRCFIENGTNGLLYQTGIKESLASAVLRLVENPKLQTRLRLAAREHSRKWKFQLQDSIEDLYAFYSKVLDHPLSD